jgi:hypothetical protein
MSLVVFWFAYADPSGENSFRILTLSCNEEGEDTIDGKTKEH